jgi:hypothetical protein
MLTNPTLSVSTRNILDMIGWAELDPNTPITPAVAGNINTGIVAVDGVQKRTFLHEYMWMTPSSLGIPSGR